MIKYFCDSCGREIARDSKLWLNISDTYCNDMKISLKDGRSLERVTICLHCAMKVIQALNARGLC